MPNAKSPRLLIASAGVALILAALALTVSVTPGDAQVPPFGTPVPNIYIPPTPFPTAFVPPPVIGNPVQPQIGGNVSICGVANPGAVGGQTITDPTGSLSVTLTEPGNYSYGAPGANVGQPALAICHQQYNSTVVINTTTGREIRRVARDGTAHFILDRIVAGARLTGAGPAQAGAPTAGGGAAASTGGSGVLRPPSTGDAGLTID